MGEGDPEPEHKFTDIHPRDHTPWRDIAKVMLVDHRRRSHAGAWR